MLRIIVAIFLLAAAPASAQPYYLLSTGGSGGGITSISGLNLSPGLVTATGGSVARDLADVSADTLPIAAFGGVGDGQSYTQSTLTFAGGTTLTVSGAPFNCATDVGKLIGITEKYSWGQSVTKYTGTIAACASASSVAVSSSLPTVNDPSVTGFTIVWGTDNAAAIASAAASCKSIDFGGAEKVYDVSALPAVNCSGVTYSGRGATISGVAQGTWSSGEPSIS